MAEAYPKSSSGRNLRPSLRARDNAFHELEDYLDADVESTPNPNPERQSDTGVPCGVPQPSFSLYSQHSHSSTSERQRNLRLAELRLSHESKLFAYEDEEIKLKLQRLTLQKHLQTLRDEVQLLELDTSLPSEMLVLDECGGDSEHSQSSQYHEGESGLTEKRLDVPPHRVTFYRPNSPVVINDIDAKREGRPRASTPILDKTIGSPICSVIEHVEQEPVQSERPRSGSSVRQDDFGRNEMQYRPTHSSYENPSVSSSHRHVQKWIDSQQSGHYQPIGLSGATLVPCPNFGLPNIKVEVFNGDPAEWHEWYFGFKNLIDDNLTLTESQKLGYLKTYLGKEPKSKVIGLLLDGQNYSLVLKELQTRYGNPAQVIQAHIKRVRSWPKVRGIADISNFYSRVCQLVQMFKTLGYTADLQGMGLLSDLISKLPESMLESWGGFVSRYGDGEPSVDLFYKWLCRKEEAFRYSTMDPSRTKDTPSQSKQGSGKTGSERTPNPTLSTLTQPVKPESQHSSKTGSDNVQSSSQSSGTGSSKYCVFCKSNCHWLSDCAEFLHKSPPDRLAWLKGEGRCYLCFRRNHRSGGCFTKIKCQKSNCGKRHATLLHDAFVAPDTVSHTKSVTMVGVTKYCKGTVYLQTLPVRIHAPNGRVVDTFGILDSGSQATLIQKSLAINLGLEGPSATLSIGNIKQNDPAVSSKCVTFWLSDPADQSASPIRVNNAWVYDSPFNLPKQHVPRLGDGTVSWPHTRDLDLRDVDPAQISILIGADVKRAQIQLEIREGPSGVPMVVRTPLGWTIMGSAVDESHEERSDCEEICSHLSVNCLHVSNEQLSSQVERFWKTESFGCTSVTNKPCSVDDQRALSMLESSLSRTADGHYQVSMLWSKVPVSLPNNRIVAEKRLTSLCAKLRRDHDLRERYSKVLDSYVTEGFARKMTADEVNVTSDRTFYLPHHAVINPKKPEKLRVVFDAAATCQGKSLNSELLSGPDLINSLIGVLMRFRNGTIAMAADIKNMFHQIRFPPEDRDALRYLWSDNIETCEQPEVHQSLVHIFGSKSSPCCANYCLRRLAVDYADSFSQVALDTVREDFYVDDLLKAVNLTVPEAISLALELIQLTGKGSFTLTKWASNCQALLDAVAENAGVATVINLDLEDKSTTRTLGVGCNMKHDIFVFDSIRQQKPVTKRGILSAVSSVFDPLGFLAPFVVRAKVLLQHLWELGLGWDDPVEQVEAKVWIEWSDELEELPNFQLERCYWPVNSQPVDFSLHVFADASESAMSAVAYLHLTLNDSRVHNSFVIAKTRVAPMNKRRLTLPRLELQAAVMAVRLQKTVNEELHVQFTSVHFWSDSLIVIQYIRNESKRLKTFVANRVAEIRRETSPDQWHFVPGLLNPADDGTRGLPVSILTTDHRWLRGPEFLWADETGWPEQIHLKDLSETDNEVKHVALVSHVKSDLLDPSKFSNLLRLQRVTAWCRRFCTNARYPNKANKGALSATELKESLLYWVKVAQQDSFSEELHALSCQAALPRHSRLLKLTPMLKNGVICVGGRIENARVPAEACHQMILPKEHVVSTLVVQEVHDSLSHVGVEHTLAELRQTFWVTQARSLVKKVIHSCLYCHRRRIQPTIPKMAQLPLPRVNDHQPPFTSTGLDYFGPMLVKRGRAREKRWGCLFTCLAVRAVHLELAASLDSDAFIMALRRFIARRGKPRDIYSDNGTNFVGANRELKVALASMSENLKVSDMLSQRGIQWHFNPPKAPHMGGAWERLVRSVKVALKAILQNRCVHEDVLYTVMCEAESILNSRPLTYVSTDVVDPEPLTPGHFLMNRRPSAYSPVETTEHDLCSRKRWRHAQVLADHFWLRWRREYLPTLALSPKWQSEVANLKAGDVVLVKEDCAPRGHWPLARVIDVLPGSDGRVRVVKVKTASGIVTRPVAQLCLLEEAC